MELIFWDSFNLEIPDLMKRSFGRSNHRRTPKKIDCSPIHGWSGIFREIKAAMACAGLNYAAVYTPVFTVRNFPERQVSHERVSYARFSPTTRRFIVGYRASYYHSRRWATAMADRVIILNKLDGRGQAKVVD